MAGVLQRIRKKPTKIVAGTIVVIVILLISWSYMWEGEYLSKWAAVFTIISVTSTPVLYFVKMDEKEKELEKISRDENKRASQNLYLELKDTMETFEGKYTLKLTTGEFSFVNRFWNHDIYDGLVASAKMGFLRSDLQQRTQNVFRPIKLHNRYLHRVLELQDIGGLDLSRYYEILEDYEARLKEDIPKLMTELKKEAGLD